MLGGGEKRLNRLYIVNQCSSELDCDLKVDPFRDWRSYNDMMSDLIPTVNIYVNGEKKIDFQAFLQRIVIYKKNKGKMLV